MTLYGVGEHIDAFSIWADVWMDVSQKICWLDSNKTFHEWRTPNLLVHFVGNFIWAHWNYNYRPWIFIEGACAYSRVCLCGRALVCVSECAGACVRVRILRSCVRSRARVCTGRGVVPKTTSSWFSCVSGLVLGEWGRERHMFTIKQHSITNVLFTFLSFFFLFFFGEYTASIKGAFLPW